MLIIVAEQEGKKKMYEIYVYNTDNEQWTVIEELTNTELIKVAECVEHELDCRAFDKLDVFEAEDTGESKGVKLLRFQYLFKDWEGYVPKVIRK